MSAWATSSIKSRASVSQFDVNTKCQAEMYVLSCNFTESNVQSNMTINESLVSIITLKSPNRFFFLFTEDIRGDSILIKDIANLKDWIFFMDKI